MEIIIRAANIKDSKETIAQFKSPTLNKEIKS